MKKILSLIICLIALYPAKAQFMLGNMVIPDSLFKEYLFYCYIHGDTTTKDTSRFIIKRIPVSTRRIFGWEASLGLDDLPDPIYILPRTPSKRDYRKWISKKHYHD